MLKLMLLVGLFWKVTQAAGDRKINKLNLLLPVIPMEIGEKKIEHELEAYNGCYSWSSSNPEILQVEEVRDYDNPNCASR